MDAHLMAQHGRNKKSSSRPHHRTSAAGEKWSAEVTETSDALDLEDHVFAQRRASDIAKSLKQSAERSKRRKSSPYQSAMSMLTFYINRAGRNLPARRRQILDRAKDELRKAFHRPVKR
jgi:hypothetical protein